MSVKLDFCQGVEENAASLQGVRSAAQAQGFRGKIGDIAFIAPRKDHPATFLIGLDPTAWFASIAAAVTKLPAGHYLSQAPLPEAALLGWSLAQYRFDRYKTSAAPLRCLGISLEAQKQILPTVDAIFMIRDLINTPAEDMGPAALAEATRQLAERHAGASVTVCEGHALAQEYPAIHRVGRGAQGAPCLIHLTWGNPAHPRIILVGKGVCFDSGGLDLKSSKGLRLMKKTKAVLRMSWGWRIGL